MSLNQANSDSSIKWNIFPPKIEFKDIYFKDNRTETVVFLDTQEINSSISRIFTWLNSPEKIPNRDECDWQKQADIILFASSILSEISESKRDNIKQIRNFFEANYEKKDNIIDFRLKDLVIFFYQKLFREEDEIIKDFEENTLLSLLDTEEIELQIEKFSPTSEPQIPIKCTEAFFVPTLTVYSMNEERKLAFSNDTINEILAHNFADLFINETDRLILPLEDNLSEFQKITIDFFFNFLKKSAPKLFFKILQEKVSVLPPVSVTKKIHDPQIISIVNHLSQIFEKNWDLLCEAKTKNESEENKTVSFRELKEELKSVIPKNLYAALDSAFESLVEIAMASRPEFSSSEFESLSKDLTQIMIKIIETKFISETLVPSDDILNLYLLKKSFLVLLSKMAPLYFQDYLNKIKIGLSSIIDSPSPYLYPENIVFFLSKFIHRFFSDYLMGVCFSNVTQTTIQINSFVTLCLQPFTPKLIASIFVEKTRVLTKDNEKIILDFLKRFSFTFERYSLTINTAKKRNPSYKKTAVIPEEMIYSTLKGKKEIPSLNSIILPSILKLFDSLKPSNDEKLLLIYDSIIAEIPTYLAKLTDLTFSNKFKKAFIIRLLEFFDDNRIEMLLKEDEIIKEEKTFKCVIWKKEHKEFCEEVRKQCKNIIKTLSNTIKVSGPIKVILKCSEKFNLFSILEELMADSIMTSIYSFIYDELTLDRLQSLNSFFWKDNSELIALSTTSVDKYSDDEIVTKISSLINNLLYGKFSQKINSFFIPTDTLRNLSNELSQELYAFVKNDDVLKLILTSILI